MGGTITMPSSFTTAISAVSAVSAVLVVAISSSGPSVAVVSV
jgi:hypothetical protein